MLEKVGLVTEHRAGAKTESSDERLETMVRLLGDEAALYERLLSLAKGKQAALVAGKLQELERILGEEQELLRAVAEVEETRYALQCDLARAFGVTPGELTVTRLAEAVGPSFGPSLMAKQQTLVGLINELTATNQTNAELIQQSLAYIAFTLDAVTGAGASATYGGDGRRQRGPVSLRFFNRQG